MGVPAPIRAALRPLFLIPIDVRANALGVRVRHRREYMRTASNGRKVLATLALLLALPAIARAQSAGTISGVVPDASGAVLPGVTVSAKNEGTGQLRTATTS